MGHRFSNAWISVAVRRPRVILMLWGLLAVAALPGVARLAIEPSPASFLGRDDPSWAFYEESVERFGSDQAITLALEGQRPWDPQAMERVVRITQATLGLPGVRRVDSLASVPMVDASPEGDLRLDPVLGNGAREGIQVQALVERDRIALRNLVSEDGRVFALNVVLEADATDAQRIAILEEIEQAVGQGPAWVSGVAVFEIRCGPRLLREIVTFVPVTVLLLGLCLAFVFRAAVAVAAPLVASGLASLLVLAVMGALGTPLTLVSMTLPSLWLAFGSAYAMHVLAAGRGVTDPDALARALQPVAPPILLSGITTAAGFLALGSVPLDAIRGLGWFGGLGVVILLAATLSVVPALLCLYPLPARDGGPDRWIQTHGARLLNRVITRHRAPVLVAWSVLLGIALMGLGRLEVETDATRWWPPASAERRDFDAIRERLSGISPMNVVLEARDGGRVTQPEVLERIDALAAYLESLPEVGRAVSLADPLRQLHGGFEGDPAQPLPASGALIEQYLLLLDSVDRMEDLVSPERSSANLRLRVDDNGSRSLLDLAARAEQWWQTNGAPGFEARTTGIMSEFARSQEAIAWGQIQGLSLSLLAVAGILLLVFRSPLLVGLALIPNVLPLAVIYGVMGLLGIPLDGGTACVGAVTLGIAVDDTIHVLNGYRSERRSGLDRLEALTASYRHVLRPLVYTTAVVGIGFGVLLLSGFAPIHNLGLVTATVLILCLLADTTLLPALLLLGVQPKRCGGETFVEIEGLEVTPPLEDRLFSTVSLDAGRKIPRTQARPG